MPTSIYDSSLITQRRRDKAISDSFINRIQNSKTGSAPLLGISEQSIINSVRNGQMSAYRKNDSGFTNINTGCPCISFPVSNPLYTFFSGWATSISNGDLTPRKVVTDSNGNIYITGLFKGSITLNSYISGGNGSTINTIPYGTLTSTNTTNYIAFVVKYNSYGTAQWATRIETVGTVPIFPNSISCDTSGNVYIDGYYGVNSNPSPSTLTIYSYTSGCIPGTNPITTTPYGTLLNSTGLADIFLIKYNTNGIAQWATNVAGAGTEYSYTSSIDLSGNVYITGYFGPSSTIIYNYVSGCTPGTAPIITSSYTTLTSDGLRDSFLVKYNSSGSGQWVTRVGGGGNDYVIGMSIDTSGNIYCSGYYNSSSLQIYEYSGSITPTPTVLYGTLANSASPSPVRDIYIVKYNSSGKCKWVTRINGPFSIIQLINTSTDITGNVYIYGYSELTITINNYVSGGGGGTAININQYGVLNPPVGGETVFIIKYSSEGVAQWATNLSVITSFSDITINNNSISVDTSNNIYISGYYANTLTINSYANNTGVISTTPYGTLSNIDKDGFVAKYNTNGIAQWITKIAGTNYDSSNGISIDSDSNVIVTGGYNSSPVTIYKYVSGCTPGTSMVTTAPYGTLLLDGANNGFIIKYNTNGTI